LFSQICFTSFAVVNTYKGGLEIPLLSVTLKNSTWFQTDLGYAATKEKLLQSRQNVLFDPEADYQGRLHFHLKNFKDVTFQITTNSKLGIYYPKETTYEPFLEQLKPYLLRPDNTSAKKFKIIEQSKLTKENQKPSTEKPLTSLTSEERKMLMFASLCYTPKAYKKLQEEILRKHEK